MKPPASQAVPVPEDREKAGERVTVKCDKLYGTRRVVVFIFPFLILTWGEGELPLLDSPVESGGLGIHSNLHVLEPR